MRNSAIVFIIALDVKQCWTADITVDSTLSVAATIYFSTAIYTILFCIMVHGATKRQLYSHHERSGNVTAKCAGTQQETFCGGEFV